MEIREQRLAKAHEVVETCKDLMRLDSLNYMRYMLVRSALSNLERAIAAVESNAGHRIYDNPLGRIPALIDQVERFYELATRQTA